MLTYKEAKEMLAWRTIKKLCNNTWIERSVSWEPDFISVSFHETEIIRMFPEGLYVLDCKGERTKSTKDRLNKFGPKFVFMSKGNWIYEDGTPYEDGVHVNEKGKIIPFFHPVIREALGEQSKPDDEMAMNLFRIAFYEREIPALYAFIDRCEELEIGTETIRHYARAYGILKS